MNIEKRFYDLVRNYFPGADSKLCEHILHEQTPFSIVTDINEIECFVKKAREQYVS